MLDALTLDQILTFLAAADEGSFSAAGRRLKRSQSVVSQTLANLEAQLGVKLFDRTARYPVLTRAGEALLADARAVARQVGSLKGKARALGGGLEAELAVAVDVMFPIQVFARAVRDFHREFPDTPLRVEVEALGGILQPVLDGRCSLAVAGFLPDVPPQLVKEHLLSIRMITVVAPSHALAQGASPVPRDELARHVQLVLTDRSGLTKGKDFGVLGKNPWRLADLGSKRTFLLEGLGWGNMPLHLVQDDLAAGRLVQIRLEDWPEGVVAPMRAVHRADSPPGPAGRWLMQQLSETVGQCIERGVAERGADRVPA
ncbi:MAG: LysR family transcriptional regulator [Alsobacter sp.]